METNRQEKPARGEGVLLATDANQRKLVIEQLGGECLQRQNQGTTDCAVRRDKTAFGPLAVLRPVMRMVAAAFGALTIMRCVTVSR